ncbi:MAG: Spy/CpxP family protein refolding chaperone [Nitrospinota bacterium]|nr:Spy/CpxP family protein refolding chaperone [Nitrospinota bacterium]
MRTHMNRSIRDLFLVFLLPLILLMIPVQTLAEDAPQPEGSHSYGGGPHGMMGGPHGESPHGEGYSHGSKHGYDKGEGTIGGGPHGKPEGSGSEHGKKKCDKKKEGSAGKHGYSRHGYSGGHPGGHDGHGKDPFRHVLQFAHKLELSAEQVQQIKDRQFAFQKQRVELMAQHEIAHLELDKLVHSGNVDEGAIRAVGDRLKQIKSQKIDSMIEGKIALLSILTDEQRKKISTLHAHGAGKGHGSQGGHH